MPICIFGMLNFLYVLPIVIKFENVGIQGTGN